MVNARTSRGVWILLLLLYFLTAQAQQNDTGSAGKLPPGENAIKRDPIPDVIDPNFVQRSIIIVDDAQRVASESFGNFMGQVDGFFSNAGTNEDAVSNDSWARIRLDAVYDGQLGFQFDQSIKVRAVLPQTERKLKLLISTEDEDTQDGDIQAVGAGNNQSGSLALRFVRSAREIGDLDLDLGIRQQDGQLQYFGRLNVRFDLELDNEKWIGKAANSYRHFNKSGFENTLSFDLRRALYAKDGLFFRTYTDFYWEKDRKGAVIGHTTGVYWEVDERRSVAYELLAGYHTALNPDIRDRFQGHQLRIRWRHNIWRPWFYYEIWPSVSWPSINDYQLVNGILLRAEVIIGKNR